jgi:hypothetical protein
VNCVAHCDHDFSLKPSLPQQLRATLFAAFFSVPQISRLFHNLIYAAGMG